MQNLISSLRPMLISATAMIAIAGCAPGVTKVDQLPPLALVSVPEPSKFAIIINKHPDATSSPVRALFFSTDMATGERRLGEAMRAEPTVGPTILTALATTLGDALQEALRASRGAGVSIAPESHGDRVEFVSKYPSLQTQASIIVDVIPRAFGYRAEWPATVYRPWVRLEYRVYDAREGKITATGFIGTGDALSDEAWIAVAQDDAYTFPSFDALLADPVRAAAGLRVTIRQVAAALAQKM